MIRPVHVIRVIKTQFMAHVRVNWSYSLFVLAPSNPKAGFAGVMQPVTHVFVSCIGSFENGRWLLAACDHKGSQKLISIQLTVK